MLLAKRMAPPSSYLQREGTLIGTENFVDLLLWHNHGRELSGLKKSHTISRQFLYPEL